MAEVGTPEVQHHQEQVELTAGELNDLALALVHAGMRVATLDDCRDPDCPHDHNTPSLERAREEAIDVLRANGLPLTDAAGRVTERGPAGDRQRVAL